MLTLLTLVLIVVMAYSPENKEIREEIIINASTEEVWSVLTDLKSWKDWNPFIINSEGEAIEGNQIINSMKNGEKVYVFKPEVLKVIENREFTWLGRLVMPGVFDGRHSYYLEEMDSGQVKLVQHETFSGILSGMFLHKIGEETSANFKAMNEALKQRAETSLLTKTD
ncbi:SRPBCC family protein [Bacteroidota bacterium]